MEFTVIGAGAIGGVIGAHLARASHDVVFCDKVEAHVRKIRDEHLHIEGPHTTFDVRVPAYTPTELVARGKQLRTVLLCVKSQDTEEALRQVMPLVGPETQVVSCQNGLCENTIAAMIGRERTIGCFVNFSADYLEPGRILYAGPSAFYVGELDGTESGRVLSLQEALSCFGPVNVTDNIWGYLWGKLSYAALLFATALVDETMATVVRSRKHRPALMELCSEVLEVAAYEGVTPLGFDDWIPGLVYPRDGRDDAALAGQLERLAARMAANAKTKSGIWRDIAVRKRKTEVNHQLGPIIEIGQRHNLSLPLTQFVIDKIHLLETGTEVMDWHHLDELQTLFESKVHV